MLSKKEKQIAVNTYARHIRATEPHAERLYRAVEAVLAERAAAQAAKDAIAQEKRRLAKLAADERKAAKLAKALEVAPPPKPELTEAERKAERDARYLARKNRASS